MSDEQVPRFPPVPQYRPLERFWPYTELPEEPTVEELAAIDPELQTALFGWPARPFSVTLVFPPFDGPDYEEAVARARGASEYLDAGKGPSRRHRARFYLADVPALKALFEIVGRLDDCDVLIDDRPTPFARELWLPLFWFLIQR